METPEKLSVNGHEYKIVKLLGHGKGGYSFLAEREGKFFTLKQLHHEPCSYYSFGNKFQAEMNDYEKLLKAGIRVPEMIEAEEKTERIMKNFIDGPDIPALIKSGKMNESIYAQIEEMCRLSEKAGLNIDYYPTNFLVENGVLFYVDYECNSFMSEWSYENWGKKFWSKTAEFVKAFGE